jgi:hypothetical protein
MMIPPFAQPPVIVHPMLARIYVEMDLWLAKQGVPFKVRNEIIASIKSTQRMPSPQDLASYGIPGLGGMLISRRFPGGNDAYTKLLLHCDGFNGSTAFIDSSASAHTITVHGNAQVATGQSKFGGASSAYDGSGDWLTSETHADFGFGTGDFTVECWVRFTSTADGWIVSTELTGKTAINVSYGGANKISWFGLGNTRVIGTTTVTTGVWYHVAYARASGSGRLFVNGTQEGATYADSLDYGSSLNACIGSYSNGSSHFLNGWIDEVRISKGIARWTANFTPPTQAYSTWWYHL